MPSRSFTALAVGALALCASATHTNKTLYERAGGITSDSSSISGQTYDYIIVGGKM